MQKFSSSYGGTKENFIVKIFSARTSKVEENIKSVLCVVQNIFRRGKPTTPSEFLISKLGKLTTPPIYLIDNSKIVLKFNSENLNCPARKFYNEILPKFLGEYSFVRNLILPYSNGGQMYFYIPQMNLTFEIDDDSHINKKSLDAEIKAKNIEILRIKSNDLEKGTKNFRDTMKNFKIKLWQNETIQEYKSALQIDATSLNVQYTTVIRLQIALMNCFKTGVIDINNPEINIQIINSDVSNIAELLNLAYEDLTHWILNVAQTCQS